MLRLFEAIAQRTVKTEVYVRHVRSSIKKAKKFKKTRAKKKKEAEGKKARADTE